MADLAQAPGAQTILVVEDDPQVRSVTVRLLEVSGYAVLEASDGPTALTIVEGVPIDLIVTDIIMPEMSGMEMVRRLRFARPNVQVLFVSGHTMDSLIENYAFDPRLNFLQKPFTREDFERAVRQALTRP